MYIYTYIGKYLSIDISCVLWLQAWAGLLLTAVPFYKLWRLEKTFFIGQTILMCGTWLHGFQTRVGILMYGSYLVLTCPLVSNGLSRSALLVSHLFHLFSCPSACLWWDSSLPAWRGQMVATLRTAWEGWPSPRAACRWLCWGSVADTSWQASASSGQSQKELEQYELHSGKWKGKKEKSKTVVILSIFFVKWKGFHRLIFDKL